MHPNLGRLDFRPSPSLSSRAWSTNGSRSQQLAKRLPEAGPAVVAQGSNQNHERPVRINHLPLLRKSAASALLFHLGNWRSAPPVPAEVHWENIGGSLRANQKQLSKRLSFQSSTFASLREMRRELQKAAAKVAQVMSWWVLCGFVRWRTGQNGSRDPIALQHGSGNRHGWYLDYQERCQHFFLARVQKVTVKSQWLWHKKCWHPNWWLECFISKKREQTLCGSFLGIRRFWSREKFAFFSTMLASCFWRCVCFLKVSLMELDKSTSSRFSKAPFPD